MQAPATVSHPRRSRAPSASRRLRQIAAVLAVVAATLAVASVLHLTGNTTGSAPFDADHAGIAEAVIGAVLLIGAGVMVRSRANARTAGLIATVFAIAGFGVGLSFTTRGGHAPDVAYHLVGLAVLVGCLVALVRIQNTLSSASSSKTRVSRPRAVK